MLVSDILSCLSINAREWIVTDEGLEYRPLRIDDGLLSDDGETELWQTNEFQQMVKDKILLYTGRWPIYKLNINELTEKANIYIA